MKAAAQGFQKIPGSNYFRLKIAYSLLLNKPIEICNIREDSITPGLTEYEISFLKLINAITNGTKFEINKTGTTVRFTPGTITNNYGDEFTFETDPSRAVTYYAEGLIPISMFGKESLNINLEGITNNDIDNSVDSFLSSTVGLLKKLVVGDSPEFKIKKRGVAPNGKGLVFFKIPIITNLAPFDWTDEGKIKRVRGTAFTSKISGTFGTRLITKSKGILMNFLPDVWLVVDSYKDKNLEAISPGYGLSLTAETKEGFFLSSDIINKDNITPEELAEKCTMKFLNEIYTSGVVNVNNQGLFLFLMALSEKNYVSQMKIGLLTQYSKGVVLLIDKLLGVKFNIREVDEYDMANSEDEEDNGEEGENEEKEDEEMEDADNEDNEDPIPFKQFIFSCVGIGLKNVARIELV